MAYTLRPPGQSPAAGSPTARLTGLDQARAVAILAMILFHFAPGAFAHVPALEPIRTPLLWFGRTATPAFVTVFGLTIGFTLLPRYVRGAANGTAARLWRRAGLVLLAAAGVALPVHVRLAVGESDGWGWLFTSYSVLVFYALALAALPLWLGWLAPRPVPRAVVTGILLWTLGTALYAWWPAGPPSGMEFVRMALVSGGYGYFQMMGTALLAVPFGLMLRRAFEARMDRPLLARLLGLGLALSAVGGAWGWAAGEYELTRIIDGDLRIPARGWYFLHFGALTLTVLAGLDLLTRRAGWFRPTGYALALAGQMALVIYTGHAFVLPALDLADRFGPVPLRGAWRLMAALIVFGLFCGVVLYARHRRLIAGPVRVKGVFGARLPSRRWLRPRAPSYLATEHGRVG